MALHSLADCQSCLDLVLFFACVRVSYCIESGHFLFLLFLFKVKLFFVCCFDFYLGHLEQKSACIHLSGFLELDRKGGGTERKRRFGSHNV